MSAALGVGTLADALSGDGYGCGGGDTGSDGVVVSCMADDVGGGEAVGGSGEGGEEDETLCKGHADCVWGREKRRRRFYREGMERNEENEGKSRIAESGRLTTGNPSPLFGSRVWPVANLHAPLRTVGKKIIITTSLIKHPCLRWPHTF